MKVEILEEAGYEWACMGMAYSYKDRKDDRDLWWAEHKEKAINRAAKLADKDGGHNKFLESIQVWIDIEATRSFWQEMDTYRVGMTKQSESTMHTLNKRRPEVEDFEEYVLPTTVVQFQKVWDEYRTDIMRLKENMPEGFLQRRVVCCNYKVLRNILNQRGKHRYLWWRVFNDEIRNQIQHPELIFTDSPVSV